MEHSDSPRRFAVTAGPMTQEEKDYLIRKGLLFENSRELFGEPSTLNYSNETSMECPGPENLSPNFSLMELVETATEANRKKLSGIISPVQELSEEEEEDEKEELVVEQDDSFFPLTPSVESNFSYIPRLVDESASSSMIVNTPASGRSARFSFVSNDEYDLNTTFDIDMDDTISQMEKLLALADEAEIKENLNLGNIKVVPFQSDGQGGIFAESPLLIEFSPSPNHSPAAKQRRISVSGTSPRPSLNAIENMDKVNFPADLPCSYAEGYLAFQGEVLQRSLEANEIAAGELIISPPNLMEFIQRKQRESIGAQSPKRTGIKSTSNTPTKKMVSFNTPNLVTSSKKTPVATHPRIAKLLGSTCKSPIPNAEVKTSTPFRKPIPLYLNSPASTIGHPTPKKVVVKTSTPTSPKLKISKLPMNKGTPTCLKSPVSEVNSPIADYMYSTPVTSQFQRVKSSKPAQSQKRVSKLELPKPLSELKELAAKKCMNFINYTGSAVKRMEKQNDGRQLLHSAPATPCHFTPLKKKDADVFAERHTGKMNISTNTSIVANERVTKSFIPCRIGGGTLKK